jgi:predicted esterase
MSLPADYSYTPGSRGRAVVVLLHGTGGTIRDMTSPGHRGDNHDYAAPFPLDRTVGWRAYPGVGIWSFDTDPLKDVSNWKHFLEDNGFGTVTYSQVDPTGSVAAAVEELVEVMRDLRGRDEVEDIALLGHSRGGFVARKFLKDHSGEAKGITHLITLHTPHRGGRLALIAVSVNAALENLKAPFGSDGQRVITDATKWITDIVGTPAFQEFAEGSVFLADLARDERQLPGIEYHTFGGTSVLYTRIVAWVYTLDSSLPQWHWPPFHHRITMVEMPGVSPILDSLPNLVDEITEGKGDILTADATTGWFGPHRTNSLNHAEALWDPNLFDQVLRILRGGGGIWS